MVIKGHMFIIQFTLQAASRIGTANRLIIARALGEFGGKWGETANGHRGNKN